MDERIKEGTFLALTAFVVCWVVKGAMLGCGKSPQANYGIWEMGGLFYGGTQTDLKLLNVLLLHCISKKNSCHSKLTVAFFHVHMYCRFFVLEVACLSSNYQVIFYNGTIFNAVDQLADYQYGRCLPFCPIKSHSLSFTF